MHARVRRLFGAGRSQQAVNGKLGAAAAAIVALGAVFRLSKRGLAGRSDVAPSPDRSLAPARSGRHKVSPRWGSDMQDLEDIARRGREIYQRHAKALEAEFPNKCVFINVDTGDYVVGGTFRDAHRSFIDRFGDAPSWDARIGDAEGGFDRTRVLQ